MLTDCEKEVIECLLHGWTQSEMSLYGGLCYQDVFDLMKKLGIDTTEAETELNTRLSHFAKNIEKLGQ
jgi:hypothetical protein